MKNLDENWIKILQRDNKDLEEIEEIFPEEDEDYDDEGEVTRPNPSLFMNAARVNPLIRV